MNTSQNPQLSCTEARYKRQECGKNCGPEFVSTSPFIRKIFGAQSTILSSSQWAIHTMNTKYHLIILLDHCDEEGEGGVILINL